MACHNMDLPFFSLKLRDPISIDAQSSEVNDETAPSWSIITYEFPRQDDQRPVKMVWYDGGKKPSADLVKGQKLPENGVIMIGDKDTLFIPSYWGGGSFLSGAKVEDFKIVRKLCRACRALKKTITRNGSTCAKVVPGRCQISITPDPWPKRSFWATWRCGPAGRSSGTQKS